MWTGKTAKEGDHRRLSFYSFQLVLDYVFHQPHKKLGAYLAVRYAISHRTFHGVVFVHRNVSVSVLYISARYFLAPPSAFSLLVEVPIRIDWPWLKTPLCASFLHSLLFMTLSWSSAKLLKLTPAISGIRSDWRFIPSTNRDTWIWE